MSLTPCNERQAACVSGPRVPLLPWGSQGASQQLPALKHDTAQWPFSPELELPARGAPTLVCPMYVRMHFLCPLTSQILMLPSRPADSSRWPVSGKKLLGGGGGDGKGSESEVQHVWRNEHGLQGGAAARATVGSCTPTLPWCLLASSPRPHRIALTPLVCPLQVWMWRLGRKHASACGGGAATDTGWQPSLMHASCCAVAGNAAQQVETEEHAQAAPPLRCPPRACCAPWGTPASCGLQARQGQAGGCAG